VKHERISISPYYCKSTGKVKRGRLKGIAVLTSFLRKHPFL